jgi:peptidoglycan/LPS O-acetylase OafA/YrhL
VSAGTAARVARSVPATPRVSADSHLSGLDIARGLAAIAVVLFHFTNNGWLPKDHWMTGIGWYGHLGVRAFFVMSGFVVPFAMWRGGYTGQAFFSFMARRLARLYPPYLISVCIAAICAVGPGVHLSAGALAAHAFYLNDLVGAPWLMEVYWTLAIEVQFYLAVAIVWRVVAYGRSWPFVGLSIATIAALFLPWPARSLPTFGPYFLLGIAAFRWHGEIGPRIVNGIVAALGTVAIWRMDGISAACAALIPLGFLALPMTAPRWGRFLGDVSYSLYLFHLVTGAALLSALGALPLSTNLRATLVIVALAISIAAAWIAFRLIEAPAIRWAKRFAYRPSVTAVKASPTAVALPLQG